jgi:hypothetical protein
VRRLALTTHRLRPAEMRLLADGPHLTDLEALSLGCYGIDRAAVEALAGGRLLGRLESLEVRTFDGHDAPWADVLLTAPATRGLAELSLMAFDAAGDLLPRLCQSPPFTRLAGLYLHQFALGDQSLGEFLDWLPPTLTHLGLAGTRLGDRAAASLARAPQLRQLRRLGLSQNRITDAGAMALADSSNLLAPTRLDLEGNPIGERVRNALRVRLGHQVEIDE